MANREIQFSSEQFMTKKKIEKKNDSFPTIEELKKKYPDLIKDVWRSPRKINTFDLEEWKQMFDVFSTTSRSGP